MNDLRAFYTQRLSFTIDNNKNHNMNATLWNYGLYLGCIAALIAIFGLNRDRIAYRDYIEQLELRLDRYETVQPIKVSHPVTLDGEADFMIAEMNAKQRRNGGINYYLIGFCGLMVASVSAGALITRSHKNKNLVEQVAASDR